MRKILDPDNGFGRFLTCCFDLIWINLLTLFCSFPIVTFGAAQSAMYYALLKLRKNEGGSVTSCFFHSFRQNIKQGVVLSLIYILFFCIIVFDIALGSRSENQGFRLIIFVAPIVAFLAAATYVWSFPLLSRYNNTVIGTIKTAFAVSLSYPGKTVLMILLDVLPVALLLLTGRFLPALAILGISLPGYIICGIYKNVFEIMENPKDSEE